MDFVLRRVTQNRRLVMTNGSHWEPAPGESQTVEEWQPRARILVRRQFGGAAWDCELTNLETGDKIFARKED